MKPRSIPIQRIAPPRCGNHREPREGSIFFVRCERSRRIVRAEDVGDLSVGIQNDHNKDAGVQVFRNLLVHLTPAIVRRPNLDDKLRHFRPVALGQRALGQPRVTVIGNIGTAHAYRDRVR